MTLRWSKTCFIPAYLIWITDFRTAERVRQLGNRFFNVSQNFLKVVQLFWQFLCQKWWDTAKKSITEPPSQFSCSKVSNSLLNSIIQTKCVFQYIFPHAAYSRKGGPKYVFLAVQNKIGWSKIKLKMTSGFVIFLAHISIKLAWTTICFDNNIQLFVMTCWTSHFV